MTACEPCANGYHEGCDHGAWERTADRLFPTPCKCWAETDHQGDQ